MRIRTDFINRVKIPSSRLLDQARNPFQLPTSIFIWLKSSNASKAKALETTNKAIKLKAINFFMLISLWFISENIQNNVRMHEIKKDIRLH